MKKATLFLAALLLAGATANAAPAQHQHGGHTGHGSQAEKAEAKEVTVVGYVSDSACGLKHMEGMGEKDCVLACAKNGKIVLADRDNKTVYELDEEGQKKAGAFAGQKVKVTGHLTGRSIHVMKVEAAS